MPLDLLCHRASNHPTKHRNDYSPVKFSQSSGYKALDFNNKQHRIPAVLVLVGKLKNNKISNIKLTLYSVTIVCQKLSQDGFLITSSLHGTVV